MQFEVHLIVVGKLREKSWQVIEEEYLKRFSSLKIIHHELKSSAENQEMEELLILKKMDELKKSSPIDFILCDEKGKNYSSVEFSQWLFSYLKTKKRVGFVIGGAFGFQEKTLAKASDKVSFSRLTFPHQLARIVLVEQLFRAECIDKGHPYHHI